jgi:hypothetical protein
MQTTEDSSTKGLHTTDRRFENPYSGFRVYTSINKDQRTRGVSRFTTNGLALTANRCSVAVCTTLQRYGIALTTNHTVRPSWELRQGLFSLGSSPTLYHQHRQLARNLTGSLRQHVYFDITSRSFSRHDVPLQFHFPFVKSQRKSNELR